MDYNKVMTKTLGKDEVNLVELVAFHISEIINKEAAEIFLNHNDIKTCYNVNQLMQKIRINVALKNMLLVFSNRTGKDVTSLFSYMIDDSDNGVWIDLIDRVILLYCRDNELFKIISK